MRAEESEAEEDRINFEIDKKLKAMEDAAEDDRINQEIDKKLEAAENDAEEERVDFELNEKLKSVEDGAEEDRINFEINQKLTAAENESNQDESEGFTELEENSSSEEESVKDVNSESDADSLEIYSNSDEEYVPEAPISKPVPKQIESKNDVNPLRALLNKEMAKNETGRQILEEEKRKKEEERLAKIPKEPEKPPSPKYKTVLQLRSTFPEPQTYSRKRPAYTGIGNDIYHTYNTIKVRIDNKPSKAQIKAQKEAEIAEINRQLDLEKERRESTSRGRRKANKKRWDPKANKIKELDRKVQAVLNDEKGKTLKKKPF